MKSKIIIPRKDHEVYFIISPEGIKRRDAQYMIYDKLSELHPGFNATTRVDIKTIELNETKWFMVTVMAGETLAEYQIIHKKAILYTNTSIMANTKNFTINAPEKIDDELIGFDIKKNEPVSIPLEIEKDSKNQIFAGDMEKVPFMHGVFNKEKPKWITAAAAVFVMMLVFLPVIFISNNKDKDTITTPVQYERQIDKKELIPSAFSLLANITELFLMENGEIERWQYNTANNPEVTIQCSGISALTAVTIFGHVKYFALDDIHNINYTNGIPAATIYLRTKHDNYLTPVSYAFANQENILIAAEELTVLFDNQNITINSEIFPSAGNGFMTYTISYTAEERMLVGSMNIIEEICNKYSLFVRSFDIASNSEKRTFTITCAFSFNETFSSEIVPNDKKQKIPLAFGYHPAGYLTYTPIIEQIPERTSLIGTIKDSNNHTIFFHDSEGKIKTRSVW